MARMLARWSDTFETLARIPRRHHLIGRMRSRFRPPNLYRGVPREASWCRVVSTMPEGSSAQCDATPRIGWPPESRTNPKRRNARQRDVALTGKRSRPSRDVHCSPWLPGRPPRRLPRLPGRLSQRVPGRDATSRVIAARAASTSCAVSKKTTPRGRRPTPARSQTPRSSRQSPRAMSRSGRRHIRPSNPGRRQRRLCSSRAHEGPVRWAASEIGRAHV